jgi:hypothetical protein
MKSSDKPCKKNTRAIGQRNKLKTKKWLESQGYWTENSEVNKICYFGGRLVAVHKDLAGSDLLAMNGKDIIFVQCKTNKVDMSDGRKEFDKYPFPDFVERWVVRWEARAKSPIIMVCKTKSDKV